MTALLLGMPVEIGDSDWYHDGHRIVARAARTLREGGTPVDAVTLLRELNRIGRLEEAGGSPYLVELLDASPDIGHLSDHAEIVRRTARARRLAARLATAQGLLAGGSDPDEVEAYVARTGEAEGDAGPHETPTIDEPMRGLSALSRVAIIGLDRFRALASEPVPYIWQDIAIAATIILIAGAPSGGKTTLLFLILAARLQLGEPIELLGRELLPAPAGRYVVLIEGEHGESSAARKMLRSCALLGVEDSGLDRLILIARKAVRLGSPEWRDIQRLVAAGLVSDIAIDTVARVAPANPDSEQEQVALFDSVAQTIELAPDGCQPTCWAVAHTRKSTTGGLEDVSGSTQRTGQADSVLLLAAEKCAGRVQSVEVTFAKLREEPDTYPEPATFAIADGRIVESRTQRPGDSRPLEVRIVDLLQTGPKTKSAISTKLGVRKNAIEDALTNLFSAREIVTTDVMVQGRPFKAFALTRTKEDSNQ